MKVLLVSFFNPLVPDSGAGLRSNSLLKNLMESGCSVHLFTYRRKDCELSLKEYPAVEASCFVERNLRLGLRRGLKSLFLLRPLAISQYITPDAVEEFVRFTSGRTYDSVVFDHLCAFGYRRHLRTLPPRTVLYEHNAEFAMARDFYRNEDRFFRKSILFLDFLLTARFERSALRSADRAVHVSDGDRELFDEGIRGKSVVIPNTLPYKKEIGRKAPAARNVLFVGSMSHRANVHGILLFIREAWPGIVACRPDVRLLIVGGDPPGEIREFHGKQGIEVLGHVEEMASLYERSAVAIAPIYIGSGSRLKILEGMMNGTMNISSPKGAEGLPVKHGKDIVIASTREEWVDSVLRFLEDEEGRRAIEKEAHDLAVGRYFYARYRQEVIRSVCG